VLCTIRGGGHTWPGGVHTKDTRWWRERVGALSRDISANDVMWQFFQRHPLR
jgi:polyhydroxybutyrate depolymerase